MLKYLKSLQFFFKNILLNKYDESYIYSNKLKWKNFKIKKKKRSVILIDLFDWKPLIHFWSYVVNLLSKFYSADVKFFYFNPHRGLLSKSSLFTRKLEKIYDSFNVSKGISEYSFRYSDEELINFEKQFIKYGKSKKKLLKYKKNQILLGDLIYDSYLRTTYKPTIDLNDEIFKSIFFKAEKIYIESKKFFLRYDVKCVVPSHVCYINYGIITRLALKKNIPVIKIRPENRGNSSFKLIKIDRKYCVDEFPYYDYKKIFSKFSNSYQKKSISIGRSLIKHRISGKFDKNLPFMPVSQFNKNLKISNKVKINNSKKEKIIIFPHCYFDNPHRFRRMIFDDFYDQINFFLSLSKKLNQYDWYYKPHPNEIKGDLDVHTKMLKKFPNIKYLYKNTGHQEILKLKPKCIITNHGTIAHEYAAFKVPVINTGDNHHVNYDFSLNIKSKKELVKVMENLDYYCKKINFDRKNIAEFYFMHFEYFPNKNMEKFYLNDSYFSFKDIKKNNTSKILKKFSSQSKVIDKNIKDYVTKFIKNNL